LAARTANRSGARRSRTSSRAGAARSSSPSSPSTSWRPAPGSAATWTARCCTRCACRSATGRRRTAGTTSRARSRRNYAPTIPVPTTCSRTRDAAVPGQHAVEAMRCGVADVARLLFGYERPEIEAFRKAVGQFRADLPGVLAAPRDDDRARVAGRVGIRRRRGRVPRARAQPPTPPSPAPPCSAGAVISPTGRLPSHGSTSRSRRRMIRSPGVGTQVHACQAYHSGARAPKLFSARSAGRRRVALRCADGVCARMPAGYGGPWRTQKTPRSLKLRGAVDFLTNVGG
jgi:hypothetical protein